MRFVICDDDEMVTQVLDAALSVEGHELVGIAGSTAAAVALMEQTKPEFAVIEPTVGCNAEFDAIDAANAVGARVVLFTRADLAGTHDRYRPEPTFVRKPDVTALEAAVEEIRHGYPEVERRHQPTRRFPTTGPSDAAAFYEAVNEAIAGDAFVSVAPRFARANSWVGRVRVALRETDLVLTSSTAVLVFMPGAGEAGVRALHERLVADAIPSNEGLMQAVVLEESESPADAFARLKDATL